MLYFGSWLNKKEKGKDIVNKPKIRKIRSKMKKDNILWMTLEHNAWFRVRRSERRDKDRNRCVREEGKRRWSLVCHDSGLLF